MDIVLLTPIRLFGDGLRECLRGHPTMHLRAVVGEFAGLRTALVTYAPGAVLVDVTQGVELFDVRAVAVAFPAVALIALGLVEQRQQVVRCGRAGFAGYVSRDASVEALCGAVSDTVAGRLACPAEISNGLLRALFKNEASESAVTTGGALTSRESEVLGLIGRGLSNKEIASELSLSVATVKQHVHNLLHKMQVQRRSQAMRQVRDAPWMGAGRQ